MVETVITILVGWAGGLATARIAQRWAADDADRGDRRREVIAALTSLYGALVQAHFGLGMLAEVSRQTWWYKAPFTSNAMTEQGRLLNLAGQAYLRLYLQGDSPLLPVARQAIDAATTQGTFDERDERLTESLAALRSAAREYLGVELGDGDRPIPASPT